MSDAASDPLVPALAPADQARFDAALAAVRPRFGTSYGLLIDGEDIKTHRARTKHSPTDRGLVLGHFAAATEHEVGLAISAARAAFPAWSATAAAERRGVVRRLLERVEAQAFELAAILSLEAGKSRRAALDEVWSAAERITALCDAWASHATAPTAPVGVWSVFAPSHSPFALSAIPVASALLAGNTVVLKAAEETPWAARVLAELLRDCGAPPGTVNLICGAPEDMGDAMFHDPRVAGASYAGARVAGERLAHIMRAAHPPRPCETRLDRIGVHIVAPHADLDAAARRIVCAAFGTGGAADDATSRLFVHLAVEEPLVARLTTLTGRLRIGDPCLPDTDLGPIPSAADHADYRLLAQQLHGYGAHVRFGAEVLGGRGLGAGNFVAPTLADVPKDDHPAWASELRLPVIMMRRHRTMERVPASVAELPGTPEVTVHGDADEVASILRQVRPR